MYKRPLILGINMAPALALRTDHERLLRESGRNTGNILFGEALFRTIQGVRQADSYIPNQRELDESDVMVIAAANWINPISDLTWINNAIDRSNLPVVVVGLGGQSASRDRIPKLKESTIRFVELVAERSKSISIRGEYTADLLASLGITNVSLTGCPSLLLAQKTAPSHSLLSPMTWSDVALHGTRSGHADPAFIQKWIYGQAYKHRVDLILQSETPDILASSGPDAILPAADWDLLTKVYGADRDNLKAYLDRHAKVFWQVEPWVDFLAGKRLCIGSRIHGTIAALISGIPAMLISHDARTWEMARLLSIPYVEASALDVSVDLDPSSFLDLERISHFYQSRNSYVTKFAEFFTENGIPTNLNVSGI